MTFTTEFPRDVRIGNKSNKPIGDVTIRKITALPNGYLSAQVGDFNMESKVVLAFVNQIPAGARERAASMKRSTNIQDVDFTTNDEHVLSAAANQQLIPDDSQPFF
jgi:hypothetical protein